MKWKRWKLGVVVAFIGGLLVAGSSLEPNMHWTQFAKVFCASASALFFAFIKDHPVDTIDFASNGNTQHITKEPNDETTKVVS